MAQGVSRWPLTTRAQVSSRASLCGSCGGPSGSGTGFFSEYLYLLPVSLHLFNTLICSSVTSTIELHKPKSNIHSYYISKYNTKLSLLTDMNCDYMFQLKFAIIKLILHFLQVPNTLNITPFIIWHLPCNLL